MTIIRTIPLTAIRIDGNTQSRTALHDATVAEYAEALTDGATLPPVVVFFDGTSNWLADGFHRFLANKRIGAVSLDADVRAGSLTDAQLFSYGANQAHGLRRTNEDKRKAVLGTLALRPDWSDRAIAKHVGVSDKTVAAQREAHCGNSAVTTDRTYTTKHGTTATMDTSGQKAAGKAKKAQPEGTSTATATAASSTPEQRAPGPAATTKTAAEAEREQIAEDAYGDTDIATMLDDLQQENRVLQMRVEALTADDTKKMLDEYVLRYEAARRSADEKQDAAARYQRELQKLSDRLVRIGKLFNERDTAKIPALVERLFRSQSKEAA